MLSMIVYVCVYLIYLICMCASSFIKLSWADRTSRPFIRAFRVGNGDLTISFWVASCIFFAQTWVKLSSLPRHSRGGILQLVGCCGTSAVHAVGGHISPVSGGRVILRILVLAKRCVWGIILQKTHMSCEHTRLQEKKTEKKMLHKNHTSSHLSDPLFLLICIFFRLSSQLKARSAAEDKCFMTQLSKPVTSSININWSKPHSCTAGVWSKGCI